MTIEAESLSPVIDAKLEKQRPGHTHAKAAEAGQVSAAEMLDLGQEEDDGPREAEGDSDPDTSDDEGERPARGLAVF